MSGTVKTIAGLLDDFRVGQVAKSIDPADMQNVIASMGADTGMDDPNNGLGLGAPNVIRGTISGHMAAGLTLGTGLSTAARQANATALQLAITTAINQNKFLEAIGTIEIYSSTGLTALTSGGAGFNWHGDVTDTQIIQYYPTTPGAPILTIGDVTGATFAQNVTIDGMWLQYGIAQTGFISANALRLGCIGWSDIRNIQVGVPNAPAPTFPAYRGIQIIGGSVAAFFSNALDNWYVNGAQLELLSWTQGGTGNRAGNFYLNGGGGASQFPAVTNPVNMNCNGATENIIDQLNIEWLSTNKALDIENFKGLEIRSLHMEGVKLTGFGPIYLLEANNILRIKTWTFVDMLVQSANFTGSATILESYGPGNSSVNIEGFGTVFNATGEVNTALAFLTFLIPGDGQPVITVKGAKLDDAAGGNLAGHLTIDPHMPVASFPVPFLLGEYRYGAAKSLISNATYTITAACTIYGQIEESTLLVPAPAGAGFTITLSNLMGATGTQNTRTGNWIHVRRESTATGTFAGTVLIKDDAATTIGTSSAANADFWFIFNGTHYVSFTPVT